MRAFFDTNVLLAAFLTEGVCEKLLSRARKRHFDLITCPFVLREFERILAKKFGATKQERDAAMALIAEAAVENVQPSEIPSGACRDKNDDHVLACAAEAAADHLVTGNNDLLHMKTFKGIRIVTPRAFELLFDR